MTADSVFKHFIKSDTDGVQVSRTEMFLWEKVPLNYLLFYYY